MDSNRKLQDFIDVLRSMDARELADLHAAFFLDREKHRKGLVFCDARISAIVEEVFRRARQGEGERQRLSDTVDRVLRQRAPKGEG